MRDIIDIVVSRCIYLHDKKTQNSLTLTIAVEVCLAKTITKFPLSDKVMGSSHYDSIILFKGLLHEV